MLNDRNILLLVVIKIKHIIEHDIYVLYIYKYTE